jgi:hypothetical protein
MKYQRITKIGLLALGLAIFTACGSKQNKKNPERSGGEMPSVSELFAEMDSNKDDKLSESEVKGPLQNDFSKIDINSDGYIDKDELENAPKPEGRPEGRGERR